MIHVIFAIRMFANHSTLKLLSAKSQEESTNQDPKYMLCHIYQIVSHVKIRSLYLGI